MENLEQENRELRGEVVNISTSMERLNALVEALVAAQNQPPLPPLPPHSPHPIVIEVQTTVISKINLMPVSVAPIITPRHRMPREYPWGMPSNFMPEGYNHIANEIPQLVQPMQPMMIVTPLVVHDAPYVEESLYHAKPSEVVEAYDRMDEFQN